MKKQTNRFQAFYINFKCVNILMRILCPVCFKKQSSLKKFKNSKNSKLISKKNSRIWAAPWMIFQFCKGHIKSNLTETQIFSTQLKSGYY